MAVNHCRGAGVETGLEPALCAHCRDIGSQQVEQPDSNLSEAARRPIDKYRATLHGTARNAGVRERSRHGLEVVGQRSKCVSRNGGRAERNVGGQDSYVRGMGSVA